MPAALLAGCALGAALGARHALEPDHLAAVSTLVAERPRPTQAARLGALWGLGHAAALLVVAGALAAARAELPATAGAALEAAVAVMLIVLGLRSLALAWRGGGGPVAAHRHGRREHAHPGAPDHVHVVGTTVALRPLVVGMLHGLAGSGALTALALSRTGSPAEAVAYVAAFGLGSAAGMAAVSGAVGASLGAVVGDRRRGALLGVAGALSVGIGLAWGAKALAALG